jgi:hypothetical protein
MLKNSTFAFAFSPLAWPVVRLPDGRLGHQRDQRGALNLLATSRATEYKLWRHDPPQLIEFHNQSTSPCVITQGAFNEN